MSDPSVGRGTDDRDLIATALEVVDHPCRRAIVRYLRRTRSDVIDYDDLLEHLAARDADTADVVDEQTLSMMLHHVHLAKMDDAGVVEYDPGSRFVRVDHAALAERLEAVASTASELLELGPEADGGATSDGDPDADE